MVEGKETDMKLDKNPSKDKIARGAEILNKHIADMMGNMLREEYKATQNPLYIFQAYQYYRSRNYTPASWVFEYFDEVAGSLINEARARKKGASAGERSAFTVYDILGMKRDVFSSYAKRKLQLDAVMMFAKMKRANPLKSDLDCFSDISDELEVNWKTVETWIRNNLEHFTTP